ncbi:hypothetical protein QCA50_018884 [Cerrena zonata]|uniref:Uncharacterized protein n=1 Tax=Cerrena zonata TaxID=2478898 RepID=A0AAW0FL84_9APHY
MESADTRLPQLNLSEETRLADSATNGLLCFLSAYPNPLFHFSSTSPRQSVASLISRLDFTQSSHRGLMILDKNTNMPDGATIVAIAGNRPLLQGIRMTTYPLSTLIVVMTIIIRSPSPLPIRLDDDNPWSLSLRV